MEKAQQVSTQACSCYQKGFREIAKVTFKHMNCLSPNSSCNYLYSVKVMNKTSSTYTKMSKTIIESPNLRTVIYIYTMMHIAIMRPYAPEFAQGYRRKQSKKIK